MYLDVNFSTGVCECQPDFIGFDCATPKKTPPVVDPAPPSVCDTAKGGCVQIKIIGTFVDIPTIKCKMVHLEVRSFLFLKILCISILGLCDTN